MELKVAFARVMQEFKFRIGPKTTVCIFLFNYRLLIRSTHDHEDSVRYWLTDAEGGGQPIPDKVFMVMSRPKSKVHYCFIK